MEPEQFLIVFEDGESITTAEKADVLDAASGWEDGFIDIFGMLGYGDHTVSVWKLSAVKQPDNVLVWVPVREVVKDESHAN